MMMGRLSMRFAILICVPVFALAGCASQGKKEPPPLTAAQVAKAGMDHQADINRILDLMSSPDLNVRISGLQQGLFHADDRNLRQLALSMAFASGDPQLRNGALLGAILTGSSLPIRFVGYTSKSHYLADRIGNVFTVEISHPGDGAAEFMARTEYSARKQDSSGKRIDMFRPGAVTGNYLKFGLDLRDAGNDDCVVALTLDPTGSALHGTLTCKNNEGYVIASSALN